MNIREISKPVTSKGLNESLAKRYGTKVALEKFTLEQLQDARNKLRTQLFNVETNESFNAVQSEAYQKSKLFLDVLNAAIAEREEIAEANDCDETCPKSCPDCGGTGDPEKFKKMKNEAAKPDYIDIDGDGDKKEPMKKAAKDAKKKKKVDEADAPNDETYRTVMQKYQDAVRKGNKAARDLLAGLIVDLYGPEHDPRIMGQFGQRTGTAANQGNAQPQGMAGAMADSIEESVIAEGAEDSAELVMAAKDMVDRVTGWMEDTAEMQTESMLELADAIRDEMGSEKSEAFTASVKPALESLYAAMEATRGTLTQGVGMLTGEGDMPAPMGMDDEAPMEPPVDGDLEMPAEEPPIEGDDFDAAAPAAGGAEEAGRAKRESVQRSSKKKLAERSRKLGTILSKKK